MTALLVPLLLGGAGLWALCRGTDVFSALCTGAGKGLKTAAGIAPSLIILLAVLAALRASGALDAVTALVTPLLAHLGIPAETAPLMLLRPLSGSGALALGGELMARFGADSLVGRTAAVMLGSTETTFYVLAVYCRGIRSKKIRRVLPAAAAADLVGFWMAAATVRWFFRL